MKQLISHPPVDGSEGAAAARVLRFQRRNAHFPNINSPPESHLDRVAAHCHVSAYRLLIIRYV